MKKAYHNLPEITNRIDLPKLLSDDNFIAQLLSVDAAAGTKLQVFGCQLTPGCIGKLDRADYSRKPRGLNIELSAQAERRFPFA